MALSPIFAAFPGTAHGWGVVVQLDKIIGSAVGPRWLGIVGAGPSRLGFHGCGRSVASGRWWCFYWSGRGMRCLAGSGSRGIFSVAGRTRARLRVDRRHAQFLFFFLFFF